MRSRLGAVSTTMVRAFLRPALGAVLVALLAVGLLGSPAGAQSQAVFSCSYTVGPTTLPPGGGFITVQGTAPGASVVRVFANGRLVAVTNAAPVTGAFSVQIFVAGSVEITVALDDYPNTPCIGVGGGGGSQGGGTGVGVGVGSGTGSNLAGTGSSGTGTLVRIGLVAVGLGLVLAVAARRRREAQASG
jgi:hypothetical protein